LQTFGAADGLSPSRWGQNGGSEIQMTKPSMSTGMLVCSYCGQTGGITWVEDGKGGTQAQLPDDFHVETRGALGRVVVCNQCDEIMLPP